MSFMFTPIDYDDKTAVNYPEISNDIIDSIVFSKRTAIQAMAQRIHDHMQTQCCGCGIAIDGYMGADFDTITNLLSSRLQELGYQVISHGMNEVYLPHAEIDWKLAANLPADDEDDPIHLFGRVFDGSFADFIDPQQAEHIVAEISSLAHNQILILSGLGSSFGSFEKAMGFIAYLDVTSKQAAIRVKNGEGLNIGDRTARPFTQAMRRNYYVDFEVILSLRKHLLRSGLIDFYFSCSDDGDTMMSGKTLSQLLLTMVQYPFRCKPVYMEGVWGGEYLRKVRNLPAESKNVAWAYEMIAFEVSLVIQVSEKRVEIPFTTLIQSYPELLMGEKCTKNFGGYFPIRFNYDDTFHGNGGLSIQVHPDEKYCIEKYNEKGAQDESYYVVVAGHGAKTFGGFQDGVDPDEFLRLSRQSQKDGRDIDYLKYINYRDSKPGLQVMIPSGTVHASGRNQVVLEIGALTTGAYTYKMFDYNRKDLDGTMRPIHCNSTEKVIHKERNNRWATQNIMTEPVLTSEGEGYQEYLIGNTEGIYFQTMQIDLETEYQSTTNGQFTVLALVDGEQVLVYSKSNPSLCFRQSYLDIVIVPSTIHDFVIQNLGYQPAIIHRTELKPGYQLSELQKERLSIY